MTRAAARTLGAWGNRATSLGLAVAFLLVTHAWIPDPELRASVQYLFVVTLGYGHLLGAVVLQRSRCGAQAQAPELLVGAFCAVTALTGLAAYAWTVTRWPALVLPLLAISAWHTVENDLAIGRAYTNGLRVGAMPRGRRYHAVSLGITGLVVLLATRTASWRELAAGLGWTGGGGDPVRARSALAGWTPLADRLDLPDLFVLVTLHHLLSWLILLRDRVQDLRRDGRSREAAALLQRLLLVHLAPALVCALLLSSPSVRAESLHLLVFGPAVYLYWSVLHVIQTSWRRGIEARAGTVGSQPIVVEESMP
jgi:hypothetical protein